MTRLVDKSVILLSPRLPYRDLFLANCRGDAVGSGTFGTMKALRTLYFGYFSIYGACFQHIDVYAFGWVGIDVTGFVAGAASKIGREGKK